MSYYNRIAAALAVRVEPDGTEPTDLQRLTVDALVAISTTNARFMGDLLSRMVLSDVINYTTARAYCRYIAKLAKRSAVMAYYDHGSDYMAKVARDCTVRDLRRYISQLFALCDTDDMCLTDRRDTTDLLLEYFDHCDDCQEWESNDEFNNTYHDNNVCRSCIEHSYDYSDHYGRYVHTDYSASALDRHGNEVVIYNEDSHFIWDDEEDMYVHREYFNGRVLGNYHSSKGKFRPIESPWTQANCFYVGKPMSKSEWGAAKHQRFYGVELEVEVKRGNPREHAEALNDHVNGGEVGRRCFFENDSSVSHGFEIITQPMGLDLHAEFWKWTQDKRLSAGLLSHNTTTCGLHVHVSKVGLTKMQLSKIVAFINHPDNKQIIEAVARRYDSSYARLTDKKVSTAYRNQCSRYEAVNMEPNRTVEFRLFKGTLKYESLMSAIEFTNALVNFCHDQSGYGFNLDTPSFMKYIASPVIAHDTKFLRAYLANKLETE